MQVPHRQKRDKDSAWERHDFFLLLAVGAWFLNLRPTQRGAGHLLIRTSCGWFGRRVRSSSSRGQRAPTPPVGPPLAATVAGMFSGPIKAGRPLAPWPRSGQHTDIFIAAILIKRWHQHVYERRIPIQYGCVVTATVPITFMSAGLKPKCKHHKVKLRTYFVSWKEKWLKQSFKSWSMNVSYRTALRLPGMPGYAMAGLGGDGISAVYFLLYCQGTRYEKPG